MAAIAGIAKPNVENEVGKMLERMVHRGRAGSRIFSVGGNTIGACWPATQAWNSVAPQSVRDHYGAAHSAEARVRNGVLVLKRDAVGAAPLYYGRTPDGALAFASELKALAPVARDLRELPPGATLENGEEILDAVGWRRCCLAAPRPEIIAVLRARLDEAVWRGVVREPEVGAWLSGGLDSSILTALARPYVSTLHTFAVGTPKAPDLRYAREVASFIKSEHHEIVVSPKRMLKVLWGVIFHLESFDALLVRSSVMNYLLAETAAGYVPAVFSGEGGDELFAGYDYLKTLEPDALGTELIDITKRLHNTALQRVDRCAAAHGLVVNLGFLDPDVLDYAMRIQPTDKIVNGVEKWILREAVQGLLPESVRLRPKAKFWDGAGMRDTLRDLAEERISDADFERERNIGGAEPLRSKEELMYYRHFHECFGETIDPALVGRTKIVPATSAAGDNGALSETSMPR